MRPTWKSARFCDYLGADSLAYLSLEALKRATGVPGAGFCDACLTGNYPVAVPASLSKSALEGPGASRSLRHAGTEPFVAHLSGDLSDASDVTEVGADEAGAATGPAIELAPVSPHSPTSGGSAAAAPDS